GNATMVDGTIRITLNSRFATLGRNWPGGMSVNQAGVLVHEGQHGIDARVLGRDPATMQEELATEMRAYEVQSQMHRALGTANMFGLWNPAWPASTAEAQRLQEVKRQAILSTRYWGAGRPGVCR